ncbi:MAG: NAD(P)H-dependent oxidoreductase subunit E [bacterium]
MSVSYSSKAMMLCCLQRQQADKNRIETFLMTTLSKNKFGSLLKSSETSQLDLIEVLQDIQASYNYLPEEILRSVALKLDVPEIEVFRVANFYKAFTLKPRGKHLVTVCMGTACHVRGAPKFVDEVLGLLKIKPGETTEDGKFTVETVNCVGACALGPVVIMDGKYYKHMTTSKLRDLVENTKKSTKSEKKKLK